MVKKNAWKYCAQRREFQYSLLRIFLSELRNYLCYYLHGNYGWSWKIFNKKSKFMKAESGNEGSEEDVGLYGNRTWIEPISAAVFVSVPVSAYECLHWLESFADRSVSAFLFTDGKWFEGRVSPGEKIFGTIEDRVKNIKLCWLYRYREKTY